MLASWEHNIQRKISFQRGEEGWKPEDRGTVGEETPLWRSQRNTEPWGHTVTEFKRDTQSKRGRQVVLVIKDLLTNTGENGRDVGSTPGSWRSLRERHGNPLQYSCLGNPMDRGGWWATVHRVTKSGHDGSDLAYMHADKETLRTNFPKPQFAYRDLSLRNSIVVFVVCTCVWVCVCVCVHAFSHTETHRIQRSHTRPCIYAPI